MTILRDLVSRVTFKTDLAPLHQLDSTLGGIKRGIAGIATTALAGWAVKAGTDVEFLRLQLGPAFGEGLDKITKKIDEIALGKQAIGLESVFSIPELRRGALAAAGEMGKATAESTDQILKLMDISTTLFLRARTTSVSQIMGDLARAMQKGGITDLLLSYKLLNKEQAEHLGILESQATAAGGIESVKAARLMRQMIFTIFEENREKLEGEQKKFEASGASSLTRVGAQLENLWVQIAGIITKEMKPALNIVAGLIKDVVVFVQGLRIEIELAGGAAEAFFKRMNALFPEHTGHVDTARAAWQGLKDFVAGLFTDILPATLTIGGVMMFLLTRNKMWILGGVAAASLASIVRGEWSGAEKELMKKVPLSVLTGATVGGLLMFLVTKNLAWIAAGAYAGGEAGKALAELFSDVLKDENSPVFRYFYGRRDDPNNQGGVLGLPPADRELKVIEEGILPADRELEVIEEGIPPTEGELENQKMKEMREGESQMFNRQGGDLLIPRPEGLTPPPQTRADVPGSANQVALITWTGDIVINGSRSPEEVARLVRMEIKRQGDQAIAVLTLGLEGFPA